jgi:hypothetical protein
MKSQKFLLVVSFLVSAQFLYAQQTSPAWEKWNHLIGEWVGEGNGQPGQGEGKFSFLTDLDGKILVRKNHTVFPATNTSPEKVHDDILIVYPVSQSVQQEAIYFDNEGNTIRYKVSFTGSSVILTSEIKPNVPGFRLTYVTIDNKTVNITFEMASPEKPEEFKIYLSGKAFKVK